MTLGPRESNEPAPARLGAVVPPPLFFLVALVAGWMLDRVWSVPLVPAQALDATRTLGGILVVLGFVAMASGAFTFTRARTAVFPLHPTTRLVTSGPYRFTRNPMYLGMTVATLGTALLWNSLPTLLCVPLAVAGLQLAVIAREERFLGRIFGADYDAYRRRVRRWI